MTPSVAGLMTPMVRPSCAAHHWPSMNIFLRVADAVAVGMGTSPATSPQGKQGQPLLALRADGAAGWSWLIVAPAAIAARGAVALVRPRSRNYPDSQTAPMPLGGPTRDSPCT